MTHEGWKVWDLVGRLGGQLRVLPGAVVGWDLTSALALGDALGVSPVAAAELLPVIEAVIVTGGGLSRRAAGDGWVRGPQAVDVTKVEPPVDTDGGPENTPGKGRRHR